MLCRFVCSLCFAHLFLPARSASSFVLNLRAQLLLTSKVQALEQHRGKKRNAVCPLQARTSSCQKVSADVQELDARMTASTAALEVLADHFLQPKTTSWSSCFASRKELSQRVERASTFFASLVYGMHIPQ